MSSSARMERGPGHVELHEDLGKICESPRALLERRALEADPLRVVN